MKNERTKTSLKKQIEDYMRRERKWIHGEMITKYSQSLGYEGETGRRRLRDLVQMGKAQTQGRKGKSVRSNWYRWMKTA